MIGINFCVAYLEKDADIVERANKNPAIEINVIRQIIIETLGVAKKAYRVGKNAREMHPDHKDHVASNLEVAAIRFKKAHQDLCEGYTQNFPLGEDI